MTEVSNVYRRQVLRAGSIFYDKIGRDSTSNTPSTAGDFEPKVKRQSTAPNRRRIHVDYADIFGNSDDDMTYYNQNLQPANNVTYVLPSPKYEQTVRGLTDESLEYFPRQRRGSNRVTASIVRNLTSEFEQLADDVHLGNEIEEKKFLKIPEYSDYRKRENKWKELKTKFAFDHVKDKEDSNNNQQQCLRRKPIFKNTDDENKDSGCTIC